MTSNILAFLSGLVSSYGINYIYKYLSQSLPEIWSKLAIDYFDKYFDKMDSTDDMVVLALVMYAEHKFSANTKTGVEKYAYVAEKYLEFIKNKLPIYIRPLININQEQMKAIIENNVKKLWEMSDTIIEKRLTSDMVLEYVLRLNVEEKVKLFTEFKPYFDKITPEGKVSMDTLSGFFDHKA